MIDMREMTGILIPGNMAADAPAFLDSEQPERGL
jgi:hypothetical protein